MHTDKFIILVETEDFYKDIANDVDKWFDTSAYHKNDNRPLPKGKNKKIIGKYKDEQNGKIMLADCNALATRTVCALAKTYAFNLDDNTEKKKAKGTKKCVIKHMLRFENYKESALKNKTILRSQLIFKSEGHNMSTEEVNKIAISNNDDKRLQAFDGITTYPIRTNTFTV